VNRLSIGLTVPAWTDAQWGGPEDPPHWSFLPEIPGEPRTLAAEGAAVPGRM